MLKAREDQRRVGCEPRVEVEDGNRVTVPLRSLRTWGKPEPSADLNQAKAKERVVKREQKAYPKAVDDNAPADI